MRLKDRFNSIIWKDMSELVNVSQEEFSSIYEKFARDGVEQDNKFNFKKWTATKSYKLDHHNKYTYLFTFDKKFVVYSTNHFDDSKNRHSTQSVGLDSAILVERRFKEKNDISLCGAFGYSPASLKICTPKQFYFCSSKMLGYHESASAIDICSQYPSCLCGSLPDWHTAIELEGTVKPNKEYPFAFYIKSGYSAEYNRYDTHNWINNRLGFVMYDEVNQHPELDPEEDITILCKASEYELTEIMQYYYNRKCLGDADAKMVMNSFIGYCHTNTYKTFRLAHLAIIALARANDRLLQIATKIGYHNIIQLCVDGIIYKGPFKYGTDTKALGSVRQEFTDCEIFTRSINNYIVKYNNKFIIAKHSSCNAWQDGRKLGTEEELLKEITSIDDCNRWIRIDYMENINGTPISKE